MPPLQLGGRVTFHHRKGHHNRTYLRTGAGAWNSAPVDTRPRATPIVPSWLCRCGRYNAPQRTACTECNTDRVAAEVPDTVLAPVAAPGLKGADRWGPTTTPDAA